MANNKKKVFAGILDCLLDCKRDLTGNFIRTSYGFVVKCLYWNVDAEFLRCTEKKKPFPEETEICTPGKIVC